MQIFYIGTLNIHTVQLIAHSVTKNISTNISFYGNTLWLYWPAPNLNK